GFDAAHVLNVVIYGLVKGHDAAGIDLEDLAGLEVEFHEIPAGVNEHGSGPREFFEDEAFAAEEPRAEFSDQGDVELNRGLGEDEGIALREDGAACRQVEDLNPPGIVPGKADLAWGIGAEIGEEERFAGYCAAERSPDFLSQAGAAHP